MRWSCIDPLSRWWLSGVVALAASLPLSAQIEPTREMLRNLDRPDAVLNYTVIGREATLLPWDIAAVELSESGGITDVFIRLMPEAGQTLEAMTVLAVGTRLIVRMCGMPMHDAIVVDANATGALYLPGTTAAQGEALRALWQGRERCDTIASEVFADGN